MVDILVAFGMVIALLLILAACSFGGLWLGAYIHHRGVSIGSGQRETFTGRVPEGEVFRIPDADELKTVPNELDEKGMARAERFLSTVIGGK